MAGCPHLADNYCSDKATSVTATAMGVTAMSVTGGVFYNDLSSSDGSLALPNEGTTLDSCFGHSDAVSTTVECTLK